MHAVILAAGRGSRMGRLTRRRPKAMLKLAGRTLLDWQIAALRHAGIDAISVVGGHQAAAIAAPADVRVIHNSDWSCSGPIASLLCAEPAQLGTVLLVYGDGVFHPDMARALRECRADIAITVDRDWHALWQRRFDDVLADAESLQSSAGQLREIGRRETRLDAIEAQFTGLVRFSTAGWALAERAIQSLPSNARARLDTTSLLAHLLDRDVWIQTIDIAGRWCEVDSSRDLALYRAMARYHPGWSHDWRWQPE